MTAHPFRSLSISDPAEVVALVPIHANKERVFWVWDPAADWPHCENVRERSHAGAAMAAKYVRADRIAVCDSASGVTKFMRVEVRTEETPNTARKFLQAMVVE
jgi:hypothetical protein